MSSPIKLLPGLSREPEPDSGAEALSRGWKSGAKTSCRLSPIFGGEMISDRAPRLRIIICCSAAETAARRASGVISPDGGGFVVCWGQPSCHIYYGSKSVIFGVKYYASSLFHSSALHRAVRVLRIRFVGGFWFVLLPLTLDSNLSSCHRKCTYINIFYVITMSSIGNTQISILLLCFLYLFVEFMITMYE